ncbi:MAG TPA: glycosyltransferase [Polyangia bacterium]|nr:glycosyltransferase [Polyangia bacterium]
MIAFVDPSASGALVSLDRHADALTSVAATGLLIGERGAIVDRVDPALLDVARSHGLPVAVLVQNLDERAGTWRPDRVRALGRDPAAATRLASALERACADHELAGVHLDLEELDDSDWRIVARLVERVAARFKPRGLEVAVDVPAFLDGATLARLGRAADRVVVMAYDEHDEDDPPGAIASSRFVDDALGAAGVLAPGRLTAGLAIYGYDWIGEEPADPLSFVDAHAAAKEAHVAPLWDRATGNLRFHYSDEDGAHEVWMTDAATLADQLQIAARRHAGAVALWRLGGEDPGIWDVLRARGVPPRGALDEVPPDDGVQNLGDGPFLSLSLAPEAGRRAITVEDGRVTGERWERSPSPYLVRRAGIVPGKVALTFDDGPDPRFTPAILELLSAHHVPATFFVIGANVAREPAIVRRAFDAGFEIGNHTFTHPDVDRVSDTRLRVELEATSRLVEALIGRRPLLYRPPSLVDIEPRTAAGAAAFARAGSLGYLVVDADVDPRDWEPHSAEELAERVLDEAEGGGVILLHDGGGDRSTTLAALPAILDGLDRHGLEIVPLSRLVGRTRDEVMPPAVERSLAAAASDRAVFGGGSAMIGGAGVCLAIGLVIVGLRSILVVLGAALAERRRRRRTFGELPTVSVVIPAFNERAVIARTVESVLASDVPVRVIVVDDGSTDATGAWVAAEFRHDARVRVIVQPNGGKSAALRTGFAAADGEVVVALDGDTLFAPETVRRLIEPFVDPRVAAVAGTAEVGNLENALTRCQALEYLVQQELERRAWDALAALPVVPGAVGAWRRSAVAALGGFSSETLAEDADLAMALCRAGWRVVYAPEARARTEAPTTLRALVKQRVRWSFGVLQALWKHRRALVERRAGAFGRVVLPSMILFQIVVPLLTPMALVSLLVAAAAGNWRPALEASAILLGAELVQAVAACWFERRSGRRSGLSLVRWLLVARLVYRPILLGVMARSLARVLDGVPLGWGKLARRGTVSP